LGKGENRRQKRKKQQQGRGRRNTGGKRGLSNREKEGGKGGQISPRGIGVLASNGPQGGQGGLFKRKNEGNVNRGLREGPSLFFSKTPQGEKNTQNGGEEERERGLEGKKQGGGTKQNVGDRGQKQTSCNSEVPNSWEEKIQSQPKKKKSENQQMRQGKKELLG